jgi:TrmH family RNA methyltransferase
MLDASLPLREVLRKPIKTPYTLIFGNEGSGLPAEFASFGQPVRIESNDKVDSLNLAIAAGIAIYGFAGGC